MTGNTEAQVRAVVVEYEEGIRQDLIDGKKIVIPDTCIMAMLPRKVSGNLQVKRDGVMRKVKPNSWTSQLKTVPYRKMKQECNRSRGFDMGEDMLE